MLDAARQRNAAVILCAGGDYQGRRSGIGSHRLSIRI
jgi:hypothetical protein